MYVPYMPIYYLIIEYKRNDRHTHDTHVNKAKYYEYLIEKQENNLLNYHQCALKSMMMYHTPFKLNFAGYLCPVCQPPRQASRLSHFHSILLVVALKRCQP